MEGTGVAEARPIDWQIFPHQLSISKTKDGKLAKLGSGAFGDVCPASPCSIMLSHQLRLAAAHFCIDIIT